MSLAVSDQCDSQRRAAADLARAAARVATAGTGGEEVPRQRLEKAYEDHSTWLTWIKVDPQPADHAPERIDEDRDLLEVEGEGPRLDDAVLESLVATLRSGDSLQQHSYRGRPAAMTLQSYPIRATQAP